MTTKAIVLAQALDGRGALGKAKDDEPVFVLVGDDLLSPGFVEMWAAALEQIGPRSDKQAHQLKLHTARLVAQEMRKWQTKNGAKVPD